MNILFKEHIRNTRVKLSLLQVATAECASSVITRSRQMTQAGDKECDGRAALLLLVVVYLSNVRKEAKTTTHVDSIKPTPKKHKTDHLKPVHEVNIRYARSLCAARCKSFFSLFGRRERTPGRDRISRLVCVCTGSALQRVVACQAAGSCGLRSIGRRAHSSHRAASTDHKRPCFCSKSIRSINYTAAAATVCD